MGNKTNPTYRRLGIPVYRDMEPRLPLPKVLRNVDLDMYGWDQPVPTAKRRRVRLQQERNIQKEVTSWLGQMGQNYLWRIRLTEHGNLLHIHVFYLESVNNSQKEIKRDMDSYASGAIRLSDQFCARTGVEQGTWLDGKYLASRLQKYFSNQRVVITFYKMNALVNKAVFAELKQTVGNTFVKSVKTKGLIEDGLLILRLVTAFPCSQLLRSWLATALSKEKHPRFILRFLESCLDIFQRHSKVLRLRGIHILVKGRLGGVDKATNQRLTWGMLPRESVSAGVRRSSNQADTPYGVFGVTVDTFHR